MQEISDASAAALQETREIAHNLHPYQISHLGLSAALNSLVDDVESSSRISFVRDVDESCDNLPTDAAINIYRIVQECMNNMVKHSEATKASVSFKQKGEDLILSVSDNGRGLDSTNKTDGLGLKGIAERAKIIGGSVSFASQPGKGTTVTLKLPVQNSANEK